jgi:hypothetical protein
VRTWAVTVPLVAGIARTGRPSPRLLTIAGLVQLGDSVLGIRQRNPRMTLAPAAMGLIHLASTRVLSTRLRQSRVSGLLGLPAGVRCPKHQRLRVSRGS